jgi:uncharacterized protein (DUF885 family)
MNFISKLSVFILYFTAALCGQSSTGLPAISAGGESTPLLEARRLELKKLVAEEWEYELKQAPESATVYGDYRYNDRWSDLSPGHYAERKQDEESFLARFEAIDVTGFPEQEQLDKALMVHNLREDLESIALRNYEMPLDQFKGVHLEMAQLVALVPLDTTKHYEDYLARLHGVPYAVDQIIALARQGEKDGLMPPKILLE